LRSVVGLSVCMCVFEALRGYLYISTVTCISLDRWHQNGNGNGGVETAVRGRTGIRSVRSDQMEAWLRFERLVRAVFDWVDGGRRGAYLTRLSRPAFGRITYIFDSHSHDARIYTDKVKAFSYGTRLLFPRPAQSLFSLAPIQSIESRALVRPHSSSAILAPASSSSQRHQLQLESILLTTSTLSRSSPHELTSRPTRSD